MWQANLMLKKGRHGIGKDFASDSTVLMYSSFFGSCWANESPCIETFLIAQGTHPFAALPAREDGNLFSR